MFAFRYFHLFALSPLVGCSVYTESLLGDTQQTVNSGGSSISLAGSRNGTEGGTAHGGVSGNPDPQETAGEANGSAAADAGGAGGTGTNNGGSAPNGGALAGGTGSVGGTTMTNAGSGGTAVVDPPTGVDMLDDMEDGNFSLLPKPPRYGFWYVAGDATVGGKLPKIEQLVATIDPARGASSKGVHFEASGFKGWGSSVGLSFSDASQKRGPYNAGNALGISFWVRGSVADSTQLKVQFPITATDPSGKLCGGAGQGQCLDHFSTQITVTSTWTQVPILFSAIYQAGWGVPVEGGFDPGQMLGIEWSAGTSNLDIWIDDLALMRP
ncbi:MAG TPA: hypothetical protein VHB79_09275 [Polyangiaceae bacterium]|nr:hypothetical protein [Polyangiaceae bacterium]